MKLIDDMAMEAEAASKSVRPLTIGAPKEPLPTYEEVISAYERACGKVNDTNIKTELQTAQVPKRRVCLVWAVHHLCRHCPRLN